MILDYLFLLGITVEAMSGTLSAGRQKMDIAGALIIANATAFGGGTIRDLLIGHYPLTWVKHPEYVILTTSAAIITMFIARHIKRLYTFFLILDAMGLVAFSLIATEIAMSMSLSPIVACILAMITGISGGMIRDILCHDPPLVLRKELYATVSLFTAILYLSLAYLPLATTSFIDELIALGLAFALRVFAIVYKIQLPKFDFKH